MVITVSKLMDWYDEFNEKAFSGDLPSVGSYRVSFKIVHTRHMLGQHMPTSAGKNSHHLIKISDYWDIPEREYQKVLLHEMCHLWCHVMGWPYEHHGWRWQNKAYQVGKMFGFDIQRCDSRSGFKVNDQFAAREENRAISKATKPYFFVAMEYPDHMWLVKVSAKTLRDSTDYTGEKLGWEVTKPYRVWKVHNGDSDIFRQMQESRSLWRGYEKSRREFEENYLPVLDKLCEEITDNLRKGWM